MGLFASCLVALAIYFWNMFVANLTMADALLDTLWPGLLVSTAVGLWVQKLEDEGRI